MSEPSVIDSLLYIERTVRLLLNRSHPQPQRAAYLLRVHAANVERHSDEFPANGWP